MRGGTRDDFTHGSDDAPRAAGRLLIVRSVDDVEEARRLHEQALAVYRAVYGTDEHPLVATSLNNLAWALEGLGDLEEAEPMTLEFGSDANAVALRPGREAELAAGTKCARRRCCCQQQPGAEGPALRPG